MTFIILAGELKDADYCETYGPFDTADEAETAAQELVSRGVIVIEPDDCMDYRVMGLINPADAKTPEPVVDVEPRPQPSTAEQFKNNSNYDADGAFVMTDDQALLMGHEANDDVDDFLGKFTTPVGEGDTAMADFAASFSTTMSEIFASVREADAATPSRGQD
jgi:hypothetical protein